MAGATTAAGSKEVTTGATVVYIKVILGATEVDLATSFRASASEVAATATNEVATGVIACYSGDTNTIADRFKTNS